MALSLDRPEVRVKRGLPGAGGRADGKLQSTVRQEQVGHSERKRPGAEFLLKAADCLDNRPMIESGQADRERGRISSACGFWVRSRRLIA
jgi:hypothetical protein